MDNDDESNNLDNSSIYSVNISLEGDESNISLDNDDESNNLDISSIYSADISLEDCDLNEDIINDTNRSMDFGKKF